MDKDKVQFTTLAVDIETECNQGCSKSCNHGLNPFKSRITCIGVYNEEMSFVFRSLLKFHSFIHTLGPNVKLIGHNFKFDLKFLYFNGIDLRSLWADDTQLMAASYSVNVVKPYIEAYETKRQLENKKLPSGYSHRKARGYSLKVLAPYFLGVPAFWENPVNHDSDEYVLKDCEYTYRLYKFFHTRLQEDQTLDFYEKRLLPWARMLLEAELQGIAIDLDLVRSMEVEAKAEVEASAAKLHELWQGAYRDYFEGKRQRLEVTYRVKLEAAFKKAKDKEKCTQRYMGLYLKAAMKLPKAMDLNSPKQLLWILQEYFKLNTLNSKKKPSTEESVIQRLVNDTGREDLKVLLHYREQQKLLSTYLKPYQELAHEGVIYCNFNPTGTSTGRISASSPNMQQVPSVLHKVFKARPGKKLATFDKSQIEARLIAYYSEDPTLMQLITSGVDFHGFNAALYFPDLKCDINKIKAEAPKERQFAKTLGFALFYGARSGRVQETSRKSGYHWGKERAQVAVDEFLDTYQTVVSYKERLDKEVVEFKGVKNLFGRKQAFQDHDDIYMKNFNGLIQGAASDMVQESARRVNEREGYQVLLLVHDELVVEIDSSISDEEAEKWITHCMTDYHLKNSIGVVPLEVEGRIGKTWLK